jgi:RHS repeat-associated protein
VTNGAGDIRERIEYFPFGTYKGVNQNPAVNYTYTDQEDDDDTGLYNFKARLYDPHLGRFISADSIVPEPGNL